MPSTHPYIYIYNAGGGGGGGRGGGELRSRNELFVSNLFSRTVRVFYSSSFSHQIS